MNRYKYLQNIKSEKTYWVCESCGNHISLNADLCPCHVKFLAPTVGNRGIDLNSGMVGRLWGADFIVSEQTQMQNRNNRETERILSQALRTERGLNSLALAMAGPIRHDVDYR